jgi:hypothetical protein
VSTIEQRNERSPEQRSPQFAPGRRQFLDHLVHLLARLGVALAQQRQAQLLEQRHLTIDGLLPTTQMSTLDPALEECSGGSGDGDVTGNVGNGASHALMADEAEGFEFGKLLGGDAGAHAQRWRVECGWLDGHTR